MNYESTYLPTCLHIIMCHHAVQLKISFYVHMFIRVNITDISMIRFILGRNIRRFEANAVREEWSGDIIFEEVSFMVLRKAVELLFIFRIRLVQLVAAFWTLNVPGRVIKTHSSALNASR